MGALSLAATTALFVMITTRADQLGYTNVNGLAEADVVHAQTLAREAGDELCVARPDHADAECRRIFDVAEAHFAWALVALSAADLASHVGKDPVNSLASANRLFAKGQHLYNEVVKRYLMR